MSSLLDALMSFNRRERHILVGWVLDRLTFPLGHEFRDALSKNLAIDVPADAYVAMDYNLNWLCGALMLSAGRIEGSVHPYGFEDGIDLGDNSDSDLLVAFARGSETHVILLEAKGYTGWDTKQLKRKSARLRTIFCKSGNKFSGVRPYWVFVSPKAPTMEVATWMVDAAGADPQPAPEPTEWMLDRKGQPRYLPLPQPASHKLAIARCDEFGKKSGSGKHWKIGPSAWPGS